MLLHHGADPNVLDKSDFSPLRLAEENVSTSHDAAVGVLQPLTEMADSLVNATGKE